MISAYAAFQHMLQFRKGYIKADFFLRHFQDYFSSYETGQSLGGAKTGELREKPPSTPASSAGLEPTPDTSVR